MRLSVGREFVVQVAESEGSGAEGFAGRVEHVASGRAAHFANSDVLLAFMARQIAAPETAPDPNAENPAGPPDRAPGDPNHHKREVRS